jgi:diguanylate cyclase (GGDEF)-like protein
LKNRLIRFIFADSVRLGIIGAAIALLALCGAILSDSVLMKMLRDDAESTSTCWVGMFVGRNPDISAMLSGTAPTDRTIRLLDEASQVGDIYRFRIWDRTGHLLYQSERQPAGSEAAVTELVRRQVADSFLSGSVFSEVHAGKRPEDVPYFVKSYIPVKRNGGILGVFEIYLDQTDDKSLYQKSLLFTESIIGILVLLAGGIPGYIVYRQMLNERAAKAEALFQSQHDALTGILNRKHLKELAEGPLIWGQGRKACITALLIDLDRFKDINDSFGHGVGDQVLQAVATRLRLAIGGMDLVARHGGDEFVILHVGSLQPDAANSFADRLIKVISRPHEIHGTKIVCEASIGVAMAPGDAEGFDQLLACADAALYKAKAEGRGSTSFFEPGMDAAIHTRRRLETDLRQALETESLQLAYQPIISFQDGRVLGFEALLRWPSEWDPQSPAAFIPVAEESGLIIPIGAWALRKACTEAAGWAKPLKVAVNLSPVQFRRGRIVDVVEEALLISGLAPARLELEVTESLWIQNPSAVLDQLKKLRDLGVSIALDDFGTGYSSLTYLWRFPFDTIKIDQSFVKEIEGEEKAGAIVDTILALGTALDLTITAEGVETEAQATILKAAGCHQGQGYLFGRPITAASAQALADAQPPEWHAAHAIRTKLATPNPGSTRMGSRPWERPSLGRSTVCAVDWEV